MTTSLPPLAFIGGGNMSRALIGGLRRAGVAASIAVAEPSATQRATLVADFPGLTVGADNAAVAAEASVWILAVKPQQMHLVASGLATAATTTRPLVVSVAAGIRSADLGRWLGPAARIVRAMPNRPALIGAGVTGLQAGAGLSADDRTTAAALLEAVGRVVWVERETDLDAVTAVSGSGPAYFLRLIELLEEAAIAQGLTPTVARTLAVETALGTAKLAHGSALTPAELRAEVTSAGGTTAAAMDVMAAADLRGIVSAAVAAAARRAAELAEEFGAG